MIYDISLRSAGLLAGAMLLLTHLYALLLPAKTLEWLKRFPRSRLWGVVLCAIASAWALWLASSMDLGEFSAHRSAICIVIVAGAIMVPLFAEEFLAVRSLGILALLAAEPLLGAAFLHVETWRLLLVVLAYLWAIAGLFLVGAPYLLRDAIDWAARRPSRLKLAAGAGVLYGLLLIAVSLLFFGQ